jgi:molecular chaperone GrpE
MNKRDDRGRPSDDGSAVDGEIELDTDEAADLDEAMEAALESIGGVSSEDEASPEIADGDAGRWQAEAAEAREKWLRAMADFDNYRKRTQREREDAQRYEGFYLLQQFLGVVDNLELALQADGGIEDLKTGVDLILRQMKCMLVDAGIEKVEAEGAPFDPNIHEAVSREEESSA